jgi:hypothetical protein
LCTIRPSIRELVHSTKIEDPYGQFLKVVLKEPIEMQDILLMRTSLHWKYNHKERKNFSLEEMNSLFLLGKRTFQPENARLLTSPI